MILMKEDKH